MICSEWNHKQSHSLCQFLRTQVRLSVLILLDERAFSSVASVGQDKIFRWGTGHGAWKEQHLTCSLTFNRSSLSRQADSRPRSADRRRPVFFFYYSTCTGTSHISSIPPLHKGRHLPSHDDCLKLNAGKRKGLLNLHLTLADFDF